MEWISFRPLCFQSFRLGVVVIVGAWKKETPLISDGIIGIILILLNSLDPQAFPQRFSFVAKMVWMKYREAVSLLG